MTSMLEQTAIDEAALLGYPRTRRPASCQRWGRRTKIALSRQGCAYVLGMHDVDMGAMSRSDRAAAEKVYGALLSDRGCLRKQRSLREQLSMMLEERDAMRLHGPRLFVMLQAGLPFLEVPEEQHVQARQALNLIWRYRLSPNQCIVCTGRAEARSARDRLTHQHTLAYYSAPTQTHYTRHTTRFALHARHSCPTRASRARRAAAASRRREES